MNKLQKHFTTGMNKVRYRAICLGLVIGTAATHAVIDMILHCSIYNVAVGVLILAASVGTWFYQQEAIRTQISKDVHDDFINGRL